MFWQGFVWFCFCCNWVAITIKGVSWLAWFNDFVDFGFDFCVNVFGSRTQMAA
jgi:hypothetical protein